MSRAAVFSAAEKAVFNDLVLKYYKYIECKKNDALSIVEKNNAWKNLTEEFNESENITVRTEKQLRRFWDNSKSRNKKQLKAISATVNNNSGFLSGHNENDPDSTDLRTELSSDNSVSIKTEDTVINDVADILEVTIHSPTSSLDPIQSDILASQQNQNFSIKKELTYDIFKQEVRLREELHALKKRKLLAEVEIVELNLKMKREELQHRMMLRELEVELKKQELRHREELQRIKLAKSIECENSLDI